MPYMRRIVADLAICGIYNHITLARIEQVSHIGFIYRIFDEMIDDIEGNGQISDEDPSGIYETRAIVQKKALSRIRCKPALAPPDG